MKERLYETGSKQQESDTHAKDEFVFTAPVDMIYIFNINGVKLKRRLKKGQSINKDAIEAEIVCKRITA